MQEEKSVLSENKLLKEFLAYKKQVENLSDRSIKHYSFILSKIPMLDNLEADDILRYVNSLKKKNGSEYSATYKNNVKMIFRSFLCWRKGNLTKEEKIKLKGLTETKYRIAQWLTEKEVTKMVYGAENILDRLVISFLASTGWRGYNLTLLKRENIDFRGKIIHPPEKEDKKVERIRKLTDKLAEIIKEYFKTYGEPKIGKILFFDDERKPLNVRDLRYIVERVSKQTIGRMVRPHTLWHYYISQYYLKNKRDYVKTKRHTGLSDAALCRYIDTLETKSEEDIDMF